MRSLGRLATCVGTQAIGASGQEGHVRRSMFLATCWSFVCCFVVACFCFASVCFALHGLFIILSLITGAICATNTNDIVLAYLALDECAKVSPCSKREEFSKMNIFDSSDDENEGNINVSYVQFDQVPSTSSGIVSTNNKNKFYGNKVLPKHSIDLDK